MPQTIQSRAQFGFYGSAFLFPCVLLLNVAFLAAQRVLAAGSPFVSQPDCTGPLVARLGGADIPWLVGWVVAAAVYLALMRTAARADVARPNPAVLA